MEWTPIDHGLLVRAFGLCGRVAGLEGVHALQKVDPLILHLREVTSDAAIVANQSTLLFFGIFHVRVMHEAADRLSAWRAQPITERLAILAGEEPLLEPDVDV